MGQYVAIIEDSDPEEAVAYGFLTCPVVFREGTTSTKPWRMRPRRSRSMHKT